MTEIEGKIASLDTIIEEYSIALLDRLDAVRDLIGDGHIHADYGTTIPASEIQRAGLALAVARIRAYVRLVAAQGASIRIDYDALKTAEKREPDRRQAGQ